MLSTGSAGELLSSRAEQASSRSRYPTSSTAAAYRSADTSPRSTEEGSTESSTGPFFGFNNSASQGFSRNYASDSSSTQTSPPVSSGHGKGSLTLTSPSRGGSTSSYGSPATAYSRASSSTKMSSSRSPHNASPETSTSPSANRSGGYERRPSSQEAFAQSPNGSGLMNTNYATASGSMSASTSSIQSRKASSERGSEALHGHAQADPAANSYQTYQGSSQTTAPRPPSPPHLDLATYPPQDLLRVLAALLQQIAVANDQLRPNNGKSSASAANDDEERRRKSTKRTGSSRHREEKEKAGSSSSSTGQRSGGTSPRQAPEDGRGRPSGSNSTDMTRSHSGREAYYGDGGAYSPNSGRLRITSAALGALGTPSSTLCFHARNVPSISIESYLLRILKYCPTTNEVFLSLLVYFDRMSRMGLGADPGTDSGGAPAGATAGQPQNTLDALESSNHGEEMSRSHGSSGSSSFGSNSEDGSGPEPHPGMRGFAIDSYNVHRLVIAGITVASKFFSDVFYTNSRYAKVGGLPVHELNQLELQFLLLNDFKLVIPLEEMQRYADQLLLYGSGQATQAESSLSVHSSVSSLGKPGQSAASRGQSSAAAPEAQRKDEDGDTAMQDAYNQSR